MTRGCGRRKKSEVTPEQEQRATNDSDKRRTSNEAPGKIAIPATTEHKKISKNKSDTNRNNVEAELSCPRCSRVFASKAGLKYHTDKQVCQNLLEQRSIGSDSNEKSAPKSSTKGKSKISSVVIEHEHKTGNNKSNQVLRNLGHTARRSRNMQKQYDNSAWDKEEREEEEPHNDEAYLDSNTESDDDYEEPKPKKKRTSISPKKIMKTNQEGNNETQYSCTACGKAFKSDLGFKYHTDNQVCTTSKIAKRDKLVKPKVHKVCSICFKTFTSNFGYNYHINNSVCSRNNGSVNEPIFLQEECDDVAPQLKRRRSSRKKYKDKVDSDDDDTSWSRQSSNQSLDEDASVTSFHMKKPMIGKKKRKSSISDDLQAYNVYEYFHPAAPGSLYITKFGIVKVIADDRLPSIHHKSTRPRKDGITRFERDKLCYLDKQKSVAESMYIGGRKRREALQKIHESGSEFHSTDIWGLYCRSLTTNQILNEKLSWKDVNGNPHRGFEVDSFERPDPRYPKDYYPDRIVECELVPDERVSKFSGEDPAQKKDKAGPKVIAPKVHIFLARKELKQLVDLSSPKFICSTCGTSFSLEVERDHHVNESACTAELRSKEEERKRSLKSREDQMHVTRDNNLSFLLSMHSVMKQEVVDVEFGNPCKIKPHKKHKMPSWIVFNHQHSSMYPELFIALNFKRGSQNRNWAGKIKTAEDYVNSNDRRRERKASKKSVLKYEMKSYIKQARETLDANKRKKTSKRITVAQIHEFALQQAAKQDDTKQQKRMITVSDQVHEFALEQASKQEDVKIQQSQSKTERTSHTLSLFESNLSSTMPPLLPSIESNNLFGESVMYDSIETQSVREMRGATEIEDENHHALQSEQHVPNNTIGTTKTKKKRSRKLNGNTNSVSSPSAASDKATVGNAPTPTIEGTDTASKESDQYEGIKHFKRKTNPVVIDTQVLASECDGGRYPTMSRFDGMHPSQCVLCTRAGTDEEDPLIDCDFCTNTIHQICLSKKMLNKEPPIIIREQEPHDSLMCHDCIMYCIARRARAESRRISKWHYELSRLGLTHPDAANLAEEVDVSKSPKQSNSAYEKPNDDSPTYPPCPYGGPGGLICCPHCSASYSRFLSNTSKEMETQSVAKAGQEVNEILDLLADAKHRLLNATDVREANEFRRKLLKKNEV